MKFPRFGADMKNGLIQLFVGSASLQGFLFLLVDDGLSVFKSGWQISIVVSLLYCLIPAAAVMYWAYVLRTKAISTGSESSDKKRARLGMSLVALSSALAIGLTLHIFSVFRSDRSANFEQSTFWIVFSIMVLIITAIVILFVQSKKHNPSIQSLTDDESIGITVVRARRNLALEGALIMIALVVGSVFIFKNTHISPFGHSHPKDNVHGEDESQFNLRHSNLPNTSWDATLQQHGNLSTSELIELIDELEETTEELKVGLEYTSLWIADHTDHASTRDESKDHVYIIVPDSLQRLSAERHISPKDRWQVTSAYLKDFGPNRGLTSSFKRVLNWQLSELHIVNKIRARYFKSDKEILGDPNCENCSKFADYRDMLNDEISEIEEYRHIIETDLKFHLKEKIVLIQFDVAAVLSTYFLMCLLLWYIYCQTSINSFAAAGGETDDTSKYIEQASFFKNLAMYLIILFLPLLKFDAEDTEVLERPFWSINWSDISKSKSDKEGKGVNVEHLEIYNEGEPIDVDNIQRKLIEIESKIQVLINEQKQIKSDVDQVKTRVNRPGVEKDKRKK